MKKTLLMIPVLGIAMLCSMAGCKKTEGGNAEKNATETASDSTTAKTNEGEPALYDNYTNEKYGYSVLVPVQMKCTDDPAMAEGANFAIDGEEMNALSVIASDNYGGQAFAPDDINAEMKALVAELDGEEGTKVTTAEESDGWTITVEGGELFHQVYKAKYKDGRRYELTYIYSQDQAKVLGNSVEKDVVNSLKIK